MKLIKLLCVSIVKIITSYYFYLYYACKLCFMMGNSMGFKIVFYFLLVLLILMLLFIICIR
jgi:hypothetical protein